MDRYGYALYSRAKRTGTQGAVRVGQYRFPCIPFVTAQSPQIKARSLQDCPESLPLGELRNVSMTLRQLRNEFSVAG